MVVQGYVENKHARVRERFCLVGIWQWAVPVVA